MNLVATIDIGTNSVLLSIFQITLLSDADESPRHLLKPILEKATVTRLGQGVDEHRRLHPEAVTRTLSCLKNYAQLLREYSVASLKVVGTSALRDASGAESFLRLARETLGQSVEIISGLREAQLTFNGSLNGLDLNDNVFVFDIGGGSTELIVGNAGTGEVTTSVSLDIGSVRLSERLRPQDPPSDENMACFTQEVRSALQDVPRPSLLNLVGLGVAGTMTTISALAMELQQYEPDKVHGSFCTTEAIAVQQQRLASMTLQERNKVPCLSTGRADVIVAGATIALEIVRWAGLSSVMVSDRGVRYGLAQEFLGKI